MIKCAKSPCHRKSLNFARKVLEIARPLGSKVLINPMNSWHAASARMACTLTAAFAAAKSTADVSLVGASAHSAAEIACCSKSSAISLSLGRSRRRAHTPGLKAWLAAVFGIDD